MAMWASLGIAAVAFIAALVGAAGAAGLAYLACYVPALLPGWLIGRALFGTGAARWIGGALVGYALTQVALWACIAAGQTHPLSFAAAWLVLTGLSWAVGRRAREPIFGFPAWNRADVTALALVLLLVPVLMGAPYSNIGRQDENGTRYYRAYFTADFVWHTALGSELGKYDMPPRNPYLTPDRLHYYWTYFLLPSVVAESAPSALAPLRDVQLTLKVNAICNAMLLAAALFLFTFASVPAPRPAAVAVALVLVAASAEGALVVLEIVRGDRALAYVTTVNIDAITAWRLDGLRIDGLARSMLYNPQHSLACALALVALASSLVAGFRTRAKVVLAIGALLGLSTIANPFLGGMFGVIYGAAMAVEALRRRSRADLVQLAVHGLAALPVLAAIAWCQWNEMVEGAGAALTLGFGGDARSAPVASLLLSLGPVMIPALAGALPVRGLTGMPARLAGTGLVVGILLMHFARISDGAWIGFRAGQIVQCVMPALVARLMWRLSRRDWKPLVLAAAAILLIGLPTTVIDVYNAQDITNLRQGPGFPWTLTVSPEQQDAFAWIRARTPHDAVVQMDAIARGRAHWSLIPTFAQRRMAAGLPISLLAAPRYTRRSETVREIYATDNARRAWDLARSLGIDYLYVDATERAAYPAGVAKLDAAPDVFTRVFSNSEVAVYRLRR